MGDAAGPATLSEPATAWPFTRTWSYTWQLPEGALPDGLTQSAVATATVQGEHGQRATTEQTLTLDVVPPAPVDIDADQRRQARGAGRHAAHGSAPS